MNDFEVLTAEKFEELKKKLYNEVIDEILKLPNFEIYDDDGYTFVVEVISGNWINVDDIHGLRK